VELIRRRFRLLRGMWVSGKGKRQVQICAQGLQQMFNIPEDLTMIWVSLHDEPHARCRWVCEIVMIEWPAAGDFPVLDVDNKQFGHQVLDSLLRKYDGKKVYVQVEYEA